MSAATPKIVIRNLVKIFGDAPEQALARLESGRDKDEIFEETGNVVAVADVSFEVGQGEIFVVMGLSGSGKSTLVRCINRLFEPSAGELLVDDQNVLDLDPEQLRRIRLGKIAMVFQHFALFPHKSVAENVEFGLKVQGVAAEARRARALEALGMVGLRAWADVAPAQLSGGMQQRVGLARALAVDPEILLMDEPFSALDPLIRRDMQQELIQLQQRLKMTVVFITHDLHEALTIGDHIAIMKDGRFVQVGTPEDIVAAPADPYVALFTRDVDRGRVVTVRRIMRPAETIDETALGDPEAEARLRTAGALFVTDRDGRAVGLILARDVAAAAPPAADAAIRREFPRTGPAAKLAELFETCALGLPIAVVDAEGRLAGAVYPADVFHELARASEVEAPAGGPRTDAAPTPRPDALEAAHG